ncbi:methylamine utilization protein MauE [Planobispora rosea]|uniref:Methylamine utilization protein MauE n=1 Tax=Planobispora rosea TaxID=35762 RepID=A0A8J3SEV1_PLARO|nr:MauE/DoxX family redox-associated membrane protein [Planobispora rosea]GGT02162.1 methylamine utilization protein MauE [Planobispora rosea]GIH88438.1 methylamine utilization protein MauE [Planobispora rosea]
MYVSLGCAVALSVVFGASLASRAGRDAFRAFAASAGPLSLFPARLRGPLAATVVAAEAVVAAGLAVGLLRPWWPALGAVALCAFAGAAGLLGAFTIAVVASLRRRDRTPCRCFGASPVPLGSRHVVRNALLLGVAVAGGVAEVLEPVRGNLAGASVAAVSGLIAGLLAVRFDDVAALLAGPPGPAT